MRLAPGASRLLVPLDGRGVIRSGDSGEADGWIDLALEPKQPIEIGADAAADIVVAGDLPLTYLLIGTARLEPLAIDEVATPTPAQNGAGPETSGEPAGAVRPAPTGLVDQLRV